MLSREGGAREGKGARERKAREGKGVLRRKGDAREMARKVGERG